MRIIDAAGHRLSRQQVSQRLLADPPDLLGFTMSTDNFHQTLPWIESLRRALGASKSELFKQYIVEAGMIGVAGGIAGVGMTWLGLRGIENVFADYDFIEYLVTMDWQMIGLAVALAIASALCAALYPTWRACRVSPASTLRIQ